jgi:16S rRNA (cytosine1402-N4)-methyltransferase
MEQPVHQPVMLAEVLEQLQVRSGGRYLDATVDGGGHTAAILRGSAPDGRMLGIDRDPELVTAAMRTLAPEVESGRLTLASGSFHALTRIVMARHFAPLDGVLFDLGLSSYHLDASDRGFTFMRDEPLDMRFDASDPALETAAELLRTRTAEELAALFRDFGEERFAKRIAHRILEERQRAEIDTSARLFRLIAAALPGRVRWRAARSAARVFQALRIAVNDELEAISEALPQALSVLAPGGRLVVLAFHSLEDRLVKHFLVAQREAGRVRLLTKRPLRPTEQEIEVNPRAASAKLRAAERI